MELLSLADQTDADLDRLYAAPADHAGPWLRVNMISTLDGAATGPGGKSGGINNDADKRVFDTLRRWCDVVVVGAGTARDEGYADLSKPLVLVTRRAQVPEALRTDGALLATCGSAEHLDEARDVLGADHVLVLGDDAVDLARLKTELGARGWPRILSEGGPSLLRDLLDQGVVDELDLTWVPRLLAGEHPRIAGGGPVDVAMRSELLLSDASALLGRWLLS